VAPKPLISAIDGFENLEAEVFLDKQLEKSEHGNYLQQITHICSRSRRL